MRRRERPTVAAPRTWRELAPKNLAQLEYPEVLERLKQRGDPLAALTKGHLDSLEPTAEHQATFETSAFGRDRLEKYCSVRDESKTPEPVPASLGRSGGNSFVIQEHHARRLH